MTKRRRLLLGTAALVAMPSMAESRRALVALTDAPLEMRLHPASTDSGLRWHVRHRLGAPA
jgi:hypothetical protein